MIGRSTCRCTYRTPSRIALANVRLASTALPPRIRSEGGAATSQFKGSLALDPNILQEEIRSLKAALARSRALEPSGWAFKDNDVPGKEDITPVVPAEKPKVPESGKPEEPSKEPESPREEESVDSVDSVAAAQTTGAGASDVADGNLAGDSDGKAPPTPKTFPPLLAIPMRDRPPIPGTVFAINVEDPEVIKAIDAMIEHKHPHFVLFHSKNTDVDSDVIQSKDSVHDIGVHCVLSKITKPDERREVDHALIVAYAQSRCLLEELTTPEEASMRARAAKAAKRLHASTASATSAGSSESVTQGEDDFPTSYLNNFKISYATSKWLGHEPYDKSSEVITSLVSDIKRTAMALTSNNEVARDQLIRADKFEPHDFADYVASLLMASAEQIQAVLETVNVQERLEMVLELIQIEDDLKRVKHKTTENMRKASFENQNKAFFREFINQFKQVAGLNEKGETDKISKYLEKVKGLKLTAEAQEAFDYELDKLKGQHENSSESFVIEKYLDWLVSVPWGIYSKDLFNIKNAKAKLEQDHYGLEDVKQRILEFISMGRISGNVDGKILCLVGPPGTGKTSIAKSIAESLNRKYVRIAMGGVQDMHELKGHRRTYVGAVPGRIILALKQAKTSNPLMLIDEIDKLETTQRNGGSGASLAFLEILDPEQNHSFVDNYLDVKVDLSKVLFVCTANYLGNIAPPLRDRMEVIEVNGYTTNEKVEITKRHLIPQAAKKAGLEGGKVEIPDETILKLIEKYCRESGLRNAKKQITRIFSKAAFKIVQEIENKEDKEKEEELKTQKVKSVKTTKSTKKSKRKTNSSTNVLKTTANSTAELPTESQESVGADKLTDSEVKKISDEEVEKIRSEVKEEQIAIEDSVDKTSSEAAIDADKLSDSEVKKISDDEVKKIQREVDSEKPILDTNSEMTESEADVVADKLTDEEVKEISDSEVKKIQKEVDLEKTIQDSASEVTESQESVEADNLTNEEVREISDKEVQKIQKEVDSEKSHPVLSPEATESQENVHADKLTDADVKEISDKEVKKIQKEVDSENSIEESQPTFQISPDATESESSVEADKLSDADVKKISDEEVEKIQENVNQEQASILDSEDKTSSEAAVDADKLSDAEVRKISDEELSKIQSKVNQIPTDEEEGSKKFSAITLEKMKSEIAEEDTVEVDETHTTPLEIPDNVKIVVSPETLKDFIGPETYPKDRVYETLPAGVATGLAYSGSGNGDALYIESILTNSIASGTGHAGIRVTGSLKDVMKESASISYSFSKQFISKRFPKNRFFEAAEIHVHCPDGAIPKDGPSAGISFTTSLVSLALNKPIAANIAMTGELTVTGRVLAVGGLREKILGAKRYGCDTIIFPKDIENVLDDIPKEVKDGVKLIPVEWYHEVFDTVFGSVTQEQGDNVWDDEFSALEKKKKKDKN